MNTLLNESLINNGKRSIVEVVALSGQQTLVELHAK